MVRCFQRTIFMCMAAAGLALSGCARAPACNDPEVLRQVAAQVHQQARDQLGRRFDIPYLSAAATEALVALFMPDSESLGEMREVPQGAEGGERRCEVQVEYAYALEGRVDKARQALEHGAVTGQTMAYMLDGEPYLSAIRKMSPKVVGTLSFKAAKSGDDRVTVELDGRDLPVF